MKIQLAIISHSISPLHQHLENITSSNLDLSFITWAYLGYMSKLFTFISKPSYVIIININTCHVCHLLLLLSDQRDGGFQTSLTYCLAWGSAVEEIVVDDVCQSVIQRKVLRMMMWINVHVQLFSFVSVINTHIHTYI